MSKKKNLNEDHAQRRKNIIDRITSGEKQSAIASELGISRQAVNQLWIKFKKNGDEVINAPHRGRIQENDHLTDAEKQEMINWVKSNKPEDSGLEGQAWTLLLVKRAIYRKFQKRVKIPTAHEIFHKAFPGFNQKFAAGNALTPPPLKNPRGRGRPTARSSSVTPTKS